MINSVVLVGRLTADVEIQKTSSGASVSTFTLAVNRQFTNQQGEREADFIQCVIWRKGAENLAQYTHKGSLIGVKGWIETSSYEKDGRRIYTTKVQVEQFALLEPRKSQSGSGNPVPNDEGFPF